MAVRSFACDSQCHGAGAGAEIGNIPVAAGRDYSQCLCDQGFRFRPGYQGIACDREWQ